VVVAGPTVAYGGPVAASPAPPDPDCELCAAVPFTEWYHDDELCWIAECDSCAVPMVVWRVHDPEPPDDVRALLHERLRTAVAARSAAPFWIDERLRSIPDHYHAHARRRPDWSS
jgi:hypothetical protein